MCWKSADQTLVCVHMGDFSNIIDFNATCNKYQILSAKRFANFIYEFYVFIEIVHKTVEYQEV